MQASPWPRKNKYHRYNRQHCVCDTVSLSPSMGMDVCVSTSFTKWTHWHCLIKCTSGLTWVFCLMQFAALYVCINFSLPLYTLLLMLVLLSTSFLFLSPGPHARGQFACSSSYSSYSSSSYSQSIPQLHTGSVLLCTFVLSLTSSLHQGYCTSL